MTEFNRRIVRGSRVIPLGATSRDVLLDVNVKAIIDRPDDISIVEMDLKRGGNVGRDYGWGYGGPVDEY